MRREKTWRRASRFPLFARKLGTMQRSVNRNERKSSVCNSVHAHTEGGRRNKFNGSSCPDFFSPRARLVISIKRSENVNPFEASSRSLHRFPRFSQLEPFVPALCIIHLSSGRQAETALISLSSPSATSRDALFTATRRKKRFMILVSSLALVFLGSAAPLPQFPRGTFSPRVLGKRS